MENQSKKPTKKPVNDGIVRRSKRISQAKPSANLLAAKRNAQIKHGNKKPVYNFITDIYQAARESKRSVRLPTGLIYDNKMTEHKCIWDSNYPESPERLISIIQRCTELNLVSRCKILKPVPAPEEEIVKMHSKEQISLLKSTKGSKNFDELEIISSNYDSTYIHPSSYDCSLMAAGGAIQLVDEICEKRIQNGFALIRPPGHHAMKSEYCGYCFFNNVAIAANHALEKGVKRILIVDWDVHHGQATQQMFYDDPRVVYFSIHRYEHGTFWPNLRESDFDYIGEGRGKGFNFNVPLNSTGMTDADYLALFHQVLIRMAYEFQPELVIISSGYDAALGCPEFCPELVLVSAGFDSTLGDEKGEMELSPAVYAHLVTSLMALASGKVAVVLEGGYCLKALADGAAFTLKALLGDPCPDLGSIGPASSSMQDTIYNVIYAHREHWMCFKQHSTYVENEPMKEDEIRHVPIIKYLFNEPKPTKFSTRNCYPVQDQTLRMSLNDRLDFLRANTILLQPKHKVCFIYDQLMMEHRNYEDKDHIEKPSRISSIFKMHEEYGLTKRLHMLKSRFATEEELKYAHSPQHLENMKILENLDCRELKKKMTYYASVYFHQNTFRSASLAAGCLLQVVDSVLTGESATGVAIVRPPGHHADIDDPCGFCIFNSVGIAARYAIKKYKLKRVLIIDWDVHHGNGTQEIFFDDAEVLYVSVHRYDHGDFFPNTGDGSSWQIGRDKGRGFNINIPWNESKMGDAEYVAAFCQIILPVAYQYNPDLVLVSAGFDAAVGDPLGGCKVTPEAFGHMTSWLLPIANGRLILSLEGGYNINSISYSMTMCTKALLGDPLPPLKEGLAPCSSAVESIKETIQAHAEYWSCLQFTKTIPAENVLSASKNLKNLLITKTNLNYTKNVDPLTLEVQLLEGLTLKESENLLKKIRKNGDDDKGEKGQLPEEPQPSTSSTNVTGDKVQTLTDFLCENIQALVGEKMYAVVPLPTCPHLPQITDVPDYGLDAKAVCLSCQNDSENWVQCGRFIQEHMLHHNLESEHPLVLSYSDLSVWCYPCQAYIDNQLLYQAKNAAHMSKFGTKMPWSYKK